MREVLIVGAGPTGLTLACELYRHGVACRVIDHQRAMVDRSRAVDVQSRTLHVFDDMGIAEQVVSRGRLLRGLSVYDRARRLARIDYCADDTPFPFAVALPQSETEQLLARRLEELGGRVERGVSLRGLRAGRDGVEVTEVAGREERRSQHAWVVGCDGMASAVREAVGIEFRPVAAAQSFISADCVVRWQFPDDELALFLSDEACLLALPLPGDGCMRLLADVGADGGEQPTLDTFASLARERFGIEVSLQPSGLIGTYNIRRHLAAAFRDDRVLLAGDAAHTYDPIGGHGMNQGIQDAYNLGWKLALVLRGLAGEGLLDSYAVERRLVARDFARDMDFGARLALAEQEVSREEHDRLLDFAVKSPSVRRTVLDSAVPHLAVYDESPITNEVVVGGYATPKGVSAGNFAPNVRFDGGSVVELLRGTEHVLLLLCGSEHPDAGAVVAVGGQVRDGFGDVVRVAVATVDGEVPGWDGQLLRDAAGALHARYGASAPCAYLVRPDGHLGFRSCPLQPGALLGYLRRIFGR